MNTRPSEIEHEARLLLRAIILTTPSMQRAQASEGWSDDEIVKHAELLLHSGLIKYEYNEKSDTFKLLLPGLDK